MSHVEGVEFECSDLDALKVAVERRGGEFMQGQTTHAWWGRFMNDSSGMKNSAADQGFDPKTFGTCEHAIRVAGVPGRMGPSGPWEVGVVRRGEGYALVFDNIGAPGKALEQAFGRHCGVLLDEMAAELSIREMLRDGYRVNRLEVSGAIVIQAVR